MKLNDCQLQGDPLNEETFIGPLIAEPEAMRIEKAVAKAVAGGAR